MMLKTDPLISTYSLTVTLPLQSKHEVVLSGTVHRMCSDACFNRFRTVNNLTMAGCANCGSFCHSKPLLLKMDDGSKTLCNSECLAAFKEAGVETFLPHWLTLFCGLILPPYLLRKPKCPRCAPCAALPTVCLRWWTTGTVTTL